MTEEGTSCQGCGTPLQTEHPDRAGYVPSHVMARSEAPRCRRCYRIEHYGTQHAARETQSLSSANATNSLQSIIASADAVLMVVDIWDFEGSFLPHVLSEISKPVFVAVNKADLLPPRTPPEEVLEWVRSRFAHHGVAVSEVRLVSAERGTGVKSLRRVLEERLPSEARVAFVGATNVGKSSLLRRWLPKGAQPPTTSALPGTTQHTIEHVLGPNGLVVLDTPGLVPGHRLADFLCPQCAAVLVPKRRLKSKLVQLNKKNAFVLGGLAAIQVKQPHDASTVTLAFTSERVPIHVTRADRVLTLLKGGANTWLHTYCEPCRLRIDKGGWEDVQATIQEGEDLVIPSLGWISPRKSGLTVSVTLPAGSQIFVRPRLIGTKSARPHRP